MTHFTNHRLVPSQSVNHDKHASQHKSGNIQHLVLIRWAALPGVIFFKKWVFPTSSLLRVGQQEAKDSCNSVGGRG